MGTIPDLTELTALGMGAWLSNRGNWLGLGAFLMLSAFAYRNSRRE